MMHQIAGKERNVGDVDLPPPVPPKPIVIRADLIYNQACADASANLKSPRPPHHSPMRPPQHRIWYKRHQLVCEIKTNRDSFMPLGVNQYQHFHHHHNVDLSLTLHNNKQKHSKNNNNILLQYTHINVVSIVSHLFLLHHHPLLPNNNNISILLICFLLEHLHDLSLYSQLQQHQVIINIIIIQLNFNLLVTHPLPLQLLQQVIMHQLIAPVVVAATIMEENHPN